MTPEKWYEIEKQNKEEFKKIMADNVWIGRSSYTVDKQGRVKRLDSIKKVMHNVSSATIKVKIKIPRI